MRRHTYHGRLVLALALHACAVKNSAVPVGGPCSSDDVCLTGSCIQDTDVAGKATRWREGYCSGNCEDRACPQGRCLPMADDKSYCVATCKSAGDCRAGYVCDAHASVCLPDCRTGWSCGSALTCNAATGSCEVAVGAVAVGGACASDNDCASAYCLRAADVNGDSTGWAGGYCSGDCASQTCAQGNCLAMADDSKLCVAHCQADGDCRGGYVCDQAVRRCLPDCREGWSCGATLTCNADNGNCQLPKGTTAVGGDCATDNDCADGFCIRDADTSGKASGWSGGYCSADCASSACPQGSCLTMADDGRVCVATCAADSNCRTGYVCAKAAAACLPDCRKGWSCGSTLTCNATNGNCQPL